MTVIAASPQSRLRSRRPHSQCHRASRVVRFYSYLSWYVLTVPRFQSGTFGGTEPMATREKATPSAGARSKASGSARERTGAAAASTVAPAAKPAGTTSRGKAASLRFHAGWREELEGQIVPGGKLKVAYAP